MNQLEQKIDKTLEELGVRPYVYHIRAYGKEPHRRSLWVFNAITIADTRQMRSADVENDIAKLMDGLANARMLYGESIHPATWMMKELRDLGYYGVSICDRRDNFSRKRGRMIAKGRLLRYLRRIGMSIHDRQTVD